MFDWLVVNLLKLEYFLLQYLVSREIYFQGSHKKSFKL